jgi:hypothetical protein
METYSVLFRNVILYYTDNTPENREMLQIALVDLDRPTLGHIVFGCVRIIKY